MIGKTLSYLREEKGYSLRDVSNDILSPSQLRRIENNSQIPSADKFIHLLYRMNITFEEFCLFTEDEYINIRIKLDVQIGETLRKRDVQLMQKLIGQLDVYYEKYKDIYFYHIKCVLKAHISLIKCKDYTQARIELNDVKEYLFSIENWFLYELTLFNNTLFVYELDTAISLGNHALKSIEKRYSDLKDDEVTRRLLNNLAVYTLSGERYYMQSYRYSSTSIGLPHSTKHIYSIIFAKIVNQVACYKLQNNQYDFDYLTDLLNLFIVMNMDSVYNEISEFLESHGIKLKEKDFNTD